MSEFLIECRNQSLGECVCKKKLKSHILPHFLLSEGREREERGVLQRFHIIKSIGFDSFSIVKPLFNTWTFKGVITLLKILLDITLFIQIFAKTFSERNFDIVNSDKRLHQVSKSHIIIKMRYVDNKTLTKLSHIYKKLFDVVYCLRLTQCSTMQVLATQYFAIKFIAVLYQIYTETQSYKSIPFKTTWEYFAELQLVC